ncbi:MAG: terminase family protein [Armatimonadota bacterium]|nr:terminase family protein [Armatimonadota bacterium]
MPDASIPATNESIAARLARLTPEQRRALLSAYSARQIEEMLHTWRFWARPSQLPPSGDWFVWLVLTGRGWGKTRCGAEMVIEEARTGRSPRIALVGRTAADVRDVMVEGESGILACSLPTFLPQYEPSKRRLTWPNGVMATTFSADEPEALRGPQCYFAWCDELAAWRYRDAWDNLLLGLRLGRRPRVVATTTPKPVPLIRELVRDPTCVVTRGTTYENLENLSPRFIQQVVRKYEGTRLGRQELLAELLEDNPDALWDRATLDATRVKVVPPLERIVVAIDPEATSGPESAETGIIAAGVARLGLADLRALGLEPKRTETELHGFVLEDASLRGRPHEWADQALAVAAKLQANYLVAETNNGGDMVISTILGRDRRAVVKKVTASRGKFTRAEPVAMLYQQHRVHHLGLLAELEDQLCTWVPGETSPDRLDALVWAITELFREDIDPKRKRYGVDFGIA